MTEAVAGLAELCQAIRDGDAAAAGVQTKLLAASSGLALSMLDQLAQAEMAGGNTARALQLLLVLERFIPDNPFILVRRLHAQIEAGVPGASDELVSSATRIIDEGLFYHTIEFLVARGYTDEAYAMARAAAVAEVHGEGVLAASRARVLFARGRLSEALAEVTDLSPAEAAHPIAMRLRQWLLDRLLDFPASDAVGRDLPLRWGEIFDLTRMVERLLFTFEIEMAQALVQTFSEYHPNHAGEVQSLVDRLQGTRAELDAALAEHGPLVTSDPGAIYAALSQPGSLPSRILWGKASLSAFLRTDGMTEAEFERFGWFLPNWEDADVRHRVLATARRVCPESIGVRQRWLGHLMLLGAYADATVECSAQLVDGLGGDTLFQAVVLLRLQQGGTVPSFMKPGLFDRLRGQLLTRVEDAEPGFTNVLHDHLKALGWLPPSPAPAILLPHDDPAAAMQRRLLAVTTGRFDCTGTAHPSIPPQPLRPVLAVSGQLRGFETAWASIHRYVCRPIEAPVVISVWNKSANATGRHARRLERTLPDDVVARLRPEERYTDTFAEAYPRTAQLLFGQTEVSVSAVRALVDASGVEILAVETESETILESVLPPFISANMLKMYYKFTRLEALLRAHEVQTGQTFSHVVWVRPDCEVVHLQPRDLLDCLTRPDIAWSSFVTENAFGDYLMVLPRQAFAAIASIFPRVCLAGDTRLLPWRPTRPSPSKMSALGAFGGPDVLFDMLLAAGYMPYNRIPRIVVRLHGRTPGHAAVRDVFEQESNARLSA